MKTEREPTEYDLDSRIADVEREILEGTTAMAHQCQPYLEFLALCKIRERKDELRKMNEREK